MSLKKISQLKHFAEEEYFLSPRDIEDWIANKNFRLLYNYLSNNGHLYETPSNHLQQIILDPELKDLIVYFPRLWDKLSPKTLLMSLDVQKYNKSNFKIPIEISPIFRQAFTKYHKLLSEEDLQQVIQHHSFTRVSGGADVTKIKPHPFGMDSVVDALKEVYSLKEIVNLFKKFPLLEQFYFMLYQGKYLPFSDKDRLRNLKFFPKILKEASSKIENIIGVSETIRKQAVLTKEAKTLGSLLLADLIKTDEEKQICFQHPDKSVSLLAILTTNVSEADIENILNRILRKKPKDVDFVDFQIVAEVIDLKHPVKNEIISFLFERVMPTEEGRIFNTTKPTYVSVLKTLKNYYAFTKSESYGVFPAKVQRAYSELRLFLAEYPGNFAPLNILRKQSFFSDPDIKQFLLQNFPKGLSLSDLQVKDFKQYYNYTHSYKQFETEYYDQGVQTLEALEDIPRKVFVLLFEDLATQIGYAGDVKFKEFQKEILEKLTHGDHNIGVPGKTFGWILYKQLDKNSLFVEQVQTDLYQLLPRLKNTSQQHHLTQAWEQLKEKYGEAILLEYQVALNKSVKNYFEILLSAFLDKYRGFDIYLSTPEIIAATIEEENAPKYDYQQIPPKFNFKKLPEFAGIAELPVWYKHNAKLRKLNLI